MTRGYIFGGSLKCLSFSSLRVRLLLLVLLAVIPAIGFILYTASEQRQQAAIMAQESALQLARLASSDQGQLIGETRELLIGLARLPDVRRREPQPCSALFADLLKQYPLYANLGAIEPDGDLFCSGLPFSAPINLADRAYFRRARETRGFVIGDYQIGRATGKATINFGYPVLDDAGDLRAVVFAALDLAWLNKIVRRANLPKGSTLTVVDGSGTILIRYPGPEKWIGKHMPEAHLVRTALAMGTGVAEAAGVGGEPYLFGFTPLLNAGDVGDVYVSIGIPKRVALAPANRVLFRNLVGLGFVGLLALLAAWFGGDAFILGRVSALVGATRHLAAGDIGARTGLPHDDDELGQLARSFDGMAESLERRYRQLKALHEIDMAVTSTLDLRAVLDILLEKIDSLFPNSVTTVRLLNKKTSELESVACRNLDEEEWKAATASVSGGLGRMLPGNSAPVISRNVQTDPRSLAPEFLRKHGLVSSLRAPLSAKGEVLGVLTLFTREEHEFTREETEFLTTLAGQAAIAIQNSQLYEELEKSNRVKDEFLSVMSHELRTPLNVVMGYTGMIKDGMLGEITEKQEEALSKVIGRSRDLLSMINEILQATSIEAQAAKAESDELNLYDFLNDLRSNYEVPLNKEVSLIWDYPNDLPTVRADREKLKHILQNLINNAIKFTPKGRVVVTVRPCDGNQSVLEFKVADTGVGIPEEALPLIFERFRQVDSSETRPYGGVGMGLYIVKKYTELLGGKVEVESKPRKGSTFTVRIPCG